MGYFPSICRYLIEILVYYPHNIYCITWLCVNIMIIAINDRLVHVWACLSHTQVILKRNEIFGRGALLIVLHNDCWWCVIHVSFTCDGVHPTYNIILLHNAARSWAFSWQPHYGRWIPAASQSCMPRFRTYANLLLDSDETDLIFKFTDNGGTISGMG
jgi:hypothetical protein